MGIRDFAKGTLGIRGSLGDEYCSIQWIKTQLKQKTELASKLYNGKLRDSCTFINKFQTSEKGARN